uniref:Uncharacterized protein n=1 Tax=Parascaris equorum TaxID=6256 RepID=A0A914RU47_PAREQ
MKFFMADLKLRIKQRLILQGTRGRYEIEPETDPSEAEQSLLGECRQLLPERPLRSSSISSVSSAE